MVATLGLLILVATGLVAGAAYRWRTATAALAGRLGRPDAPAGATRFRSADLESLPAPVVRYFRAVLRDGQPLVRRARIRQQGQFLLKPETNGWAPFDASQDVATAPPGFVWDARIRMAPGVTVNVRDGFVDGTGHMVASLMGLLTLARVEGTPEIAAGALHRYLAEAAWLPTALLPSAGVVWTPLDATSARASLAAGATSVWLDVHFGGDGLIHRVFTPERAREVGGRAVPTPWQGRFGDYGEIEGMRVPLRGEVAWLLPDGPQAYWRGQIVGIEYELSVPR